MNLISLHVTSLETGQYTVYRWTYRYMVIDEFIIKSVFVDVLTGVDHPVSRDIKVHGYIFTCCYNQQILLCYRQYPKSKSLVDQPDE